MSTRAENIAQPDSCLNKAEDDEPVFILRAKDLLATRAIGAWITAAHQNGMHVDKIESAHAVIDAMHAWRRKKGIINV